MQKQELLRQVLLPDEIGEPIDHRVDLGGIDRADLSQVNLIGLESPFRIQGQSDVGQSEKLLVLLGLGEEVGATGLEIEDHIDPVRRGDLHPWPKNLEAHFRGVVVVFTRSRRGDCGDDFEAGQDRHSVGLVSLSDLHHPPDRLLGRLFAQDAERGSSGISVQCDQSPTREEDQPTSGQFRGRQQGWQLPGQRSGRESAGRDRVTWFEAPQCCDGGLGGSQILRIAE